MRTHVLSKMALLVVIVAAPHLAHGTAEICGNGIDDTGDGQVDEGCYPSLTTGGVCESPLSCNLTGMVSWGTGSLHYDLPPDILPTVPYGPGVGLRRFYTSQYEPNSSNPTTVNHKPLGDHWQHTYLTYIYKNTGASPVQITIHTSQGRDVLAHKASTSGGYDNYTVDSPGYHVQSVKQNTTTSKYEIKLLTGETIVYNSSGQVIEIWDQLATPNKVLITWDSTSGGNVSTVTDASGNHRLVLNYTSGLLTSINYQLNTGSWTTQHTTTYSYTSGVFTGVTIGSQAAQTNVYSGGYLTQIQDGAGNQIVGFAYSSTSSGQVDRVDTSRGTVGFEFASARTGCSGSTKTVLYFNKANTTSCSSDSDCGTGSMCGGKTGSGSTGTCFKAARCLTLATSNETLVTTVSPIGAGGGACTGACTDVAQHVWSASGSQLDQAATEDPLGNYTSATYDSNGLPTQIVYADTDSNASNGGGARTEYLSYDTNFPGRLAKVKRASTLSTATCSSSVDTGCAITAYTWDATNGYLTTITRSGATYDDIPRVVGYSYQTTLAHDAKGRLTSRTGPATNVKTTLDYWTSSGSALLEGYLEDTKRYSGSTTYLTTNFTAYDFWGHATAVEDANSNFTCRSFDADRGYLTESRRAMAGQTSCTTTDATDLTTDWVRDSALRLTKLTRPDGSCLIYEYDSSRRLQRTKRRDDCNASSAGDKLEWTYDSDSLTTEIDTYNASGTLTQKQPYTYYASRKLQEIVNPVDTSKYTGLVYDDRGMITEIDDAGSLGKSLFTIDNDDRVTTVEKYKDSSTYDSWTFGHEWSGDQNSYTDGDSKQIQNVRDDLDRVVELVSPDTSYPTVNLYDEDGNLTERIEAKGGGSGVELTHVFTYDALDRQVAADFDGKCYSDSKPEIVRKYDALVTPLTCPSGVTCNNLQGRLAYVKVSLMCDATDYGGTDSSLDQETFYSYDAAGSLVEEYIRDDSGRTADHLYQWTKNGALKQVTTPASVVLGWTYGSSGSNSDTDLISGTFRTSTSTPVTDTVQWYPYGPLKSYNQENTQSLGALMTVLTRNLAYRVTLVEDNKPQSGGQANHSVTITEDAKGRVTGRGYHPAGSQGGSTDSFFKYDEQDRILCEEVTNAGTCPTSGVNLKNNHNASPPFTHAGDWQQLLRPIPGSTGFTHVFNGSGYGSSHQVTDVNQNDGTPTIGDTTFAYDARGNRTSDDNTSTLTHDDRTYSYDGRRNVTNVRGQYYTGSAWHYYDVASAYDAKNRRVFKSFYDETTTKTAQWFFYYDALDRLTEIRYTPDTSASSTYSLFQLFWLGDKLTVYWQTDYPSVTTSKRYVFSDEAMRPIAMWTWPNSGNGAYAWVVDERAWGFDKNLVGPTAFQPILFAGQYQDVETVALMDDHATIQRPGLVLNGHRTYDVFTGAYLQLDPMVPSTRSSYVYVSGDPVGQDDVDGRGCDPVEDPGCREYSEDGVGEGGDGGGGDGGGGDGGGGDGGGGGDYGGDEGGGDGDLVSEVIFVTSGSVDVWAGIGPGDKSAPRGPVNVGVGSIANGPKPCNRTQGQCPEAPKRRTTEKCDDAWDSIWAHLQLCSSEKNSSAPNFCTCYTDTGDEVDIANVSGIRCANGLGGFDRCEPSSCAFAAELLADIGTVCSSGGTPSE